jgi:hypothetical protein
MAGEAEDIGSIMDNWAELGIYGIGMGLAYKGLELAITVVKNKVNGKAPDKDEEAVKLARQALEQSKDNGQQLENIAQDVSKLREVVIEGNGDRPMTTQIAVLTERVDKHIEDDRLHKRGRN